MTNGQKTNARARRRSCCGCRGNEMECNYCLCHEVIEPGMGLTMGEEWEFSCRWVRLRKSGEICGCGHGMAIAGDWVYRRVCTEDGKPANADFMPGCCPEMCAEDGVELALEMNANHGVLPGSYADEHMAKGRQRLILLRSHDRDEMAKADERVRAAGW